MCASPGTRRSTSSPARSSGSRRDLRPGRDDGIARLAPHLGQYRLLPDRRCSASSTPSATPRSTTIPTAGKAGTGARCITGATAARRPVRDLRHGRGLPAELRDGRVLVGRPRDHDGLLWRAGRHGAAAVAEDASSGSRSSTSTPTTIRRPSSCRANGSRRGRPRRSPWPWRSPMCGSRRVSTTRSMSATHTVGFDKWKAYLLGEEDGIAEDAGMAGDGDRRSGQGRARAGARMGQRSASISPPAAGATATAAPAAIRPASNGRARWCA